MRKFNSINKYMRLRIQRLENRFCMASAWTNGALPLDVDASGDVGPTDALAVINALQRYGTSLDDHPPISKFVDTNGDGVLSPIDALRIINAIKRYPSPPVFVVGVDSQSDVDNNGVIIGDSVRFVGQSAAGVRVTILNAVGELLHSSVVKDVSGRFNATVEVSKQVHDFRIEVMDPLGRRTSRTQRVSSGDLFTNWNATALNAVRQWTGTSDDPYAGRIVPSEPPRVARNLAMIHTAMFDAFAAIHGGFQTYRLISDVPENSSAEAAAISAAYTVSTALYPDAESLALWEAARVESLRAIADGPEMISGLAFGELVGLQMLVAREHDGAKDAVQYVYGEDPGDWQRTYPGYLPPLLPHWAHVETFAVGDVTEYRAPPPPTLDSAAYAASVDEVMRLGSVVSQERTDDQTEIAIFWADGAGTYTPPGHWNQIACEVLTNGNYSQIESARTLALLNLALADAGIAAWDSKYSYDLWRPIDAIRQADTDNNPDTQQDLTWQPLLVSPPFPTYTSGHSTFSGAGDAVLTTLLGNNIAFTSQMDSHSAPNQRPLVQSTVVSRAFASFSDAAAEAGVSRIYGGIHFDFDNTSGLEVGRRIGASVTAAQLLPI